MGNIKIEILLVENNPDDGELSARTFKLNNLAYKLHYVKDGDEALDFLFCQGNYTNRKTENAPKVIVFDLNAHKVNSIEVLQVLKIDARTKNIPIVVFTSSKEYPEIEECCQLGVNGYVVKPLRFESFLKVVSDLGLYGQLGKQLPE